jgi:predicted PurR-regulated permease PerM
MSIPPRPERRLLPRPEETEWTELPDRNERRPAVPREQAPPNRWQRALFLPLTILAWLAVTLIILWLLGHVVRTIMIVVLAALLAYALSPLVKLLQRRFNRPLAVAIAYLIGVAVIVGAGALLAVRAANQISTLISNFPSYTRQIQQTEVRLIGTLAQAGIRSVDLQSLNQQALAQVQRAGGSLATGSLGILRSVAGDLIDGVLLLILSVYFTVDGPRVGHFMREGLPARWRLPARFLTQVVNQVAGGYIRGTLIMALLIGALVGVGMTVIGLPYPILLGGLAFFMEFIPVIGVLISGIVSLLVAVPQGTGTVLLVLAYFVVVHIIEGDVIGPRVMGKAVGIHPATGIIALIAGTELFGIWGALFASPLAGLIQAIITAVWRGITDVSTPGFSVAAAVAENEQDPEAQGPIEP